MFVNYQQNHHIVAERPVVGQAIPFQKCLMEYTYTKSNYCNYTKAFTKSLDEQVSVVLLDWQSAWQQCQPEEQTWIRQQAGVPSLIIRLDCTVVDDALCIYEVEERPAGIGSTTVINSDFAQRLQAIRQEWPEVIVVQSALRRWGDDALWATVVGLEEAKNGFFLIRAEPNEMEFHQLEPFSVSTIQHKGKKTYGEVMGLWQKISNSRDALPFEKPFVLKTLQGSKTRGVFLYHPNKIAGTETKTKLQRVFSEQREMYIQQYHSPMLSQLETFGEILYPNMIYRVYYGYSFQNKKWVCLGGVWNARKNVKIHGASDSLFGPVIPTF